MKKGIKKKACVVGKKWYMPRQVRGVITAYLGGNRWASKPQLFLYSLKIHYYS